MEGKKTWKRWIVRKTTEVHEVRAYTVEEARALFDAGESRLVDCADSVEKSDVMEAKRNT